MCGPVGVDSESLCDFGSLAERTIRMLEHVYDQHAEVGDLCESVSYGVENC